MLAGSNNLVMALVGVMGLLVVIFLYFLLDCAGEEEVSGDYKKEEDIGMPNIDDDESSSEWVSS